LVWEALQQVLNKYLQLVLGEKNADSGDLTSQNLDRRQALMTFMKWMNSLNQVIMGDWIGTVEYLAWVGVKGSHNSLDPEPTR